MVKRRLIGALATLCFCLFVLPVSANAASTTTAKEPIDISTPSALSLSLKFGETVFSGVNVNIYKVATVSSDYQYTLKAPYTETELALNGIKSQSEWDIVAYTLETFVMANEISPTYTAATNQNGAVSFANITTGLYLATIGYVTNENGTYYFSSALFSLPTLGENGIWQYSVSATPKAEYIPPVEPDKTIDLSVLKLWNGDTENNRPESIEVEIFKNGESFDTVFLTKENNWAYNWSAKDDGSIWSVTEKTIPNGYTQTIQKRGTTFLLINTKNTPTPPPTPDTGDTKNVLPWAVAMNISGLVLIILGIIRKRKSV